MKKFANLIEIFTSIQGEGLLVGRPQLFIRFAECNLQCDYCDTKESWTTPEKFKLERTPLRQKFTYHYNPVSSESLVELVGVIVPAYVDTIVLTGGEPLCQADFLAEFLPGLKNLNKSLLLETNGALSKELEKVIDFIDIVSMDIKLRSVSKVESDINIFNRFLEIASKKEIFIKVVVSNTVNLKEFEQAIHMVDSLKPEIAFIIQPVTGKDEISTGLLTELFEKASSRLKNVLIIPQTHKLLGLK